MNARRNILIAACSLATSAGATLAQFVPDNQPAAKPTPPAGTAPAGDGPQSPGAQPGQTEFPGPGNSKFTFPTGLYDEKAVATEQIRVAREQAKLENKRVLVMWGENMCGFCVFLQDILKNDPQVSQLVKGEYVWIKVDIGKFDKNIDVANVYNTPLLEQGFGAPALTVIDPNSDKAVDRRGGNSMVAERMTVQEPFDRKKIFEFLNASRPPAQVANSVINNALADAKKHGNNVLVYFVVPGSDDCEKLDNWMKQAKSSTALPKGIEIAKVDTQRMIGGTLVLKKAAGTDAAAAPFITILDADGKPLGPEAMLTGLPTKDGEINQFADMLKKHAPTITDAQRDVIVNSLKDAAKGKQEAAKP